MYLLYNISLCIYLMKSQKFYNIEYSTMPLHYKKNTIMYDVFAKGVGFVNYIQVNR